MSTLLKFHFYSFVLTGKVLAVKNYYLPQTKTKKYEKKDFTINFLSFLCNETESTDLRYRSCQRWHG